MGHGGRRDPGHRQTHAEHHEHRPRGPRRETRRRGLYFADQYDQEHALSWQSFYQLPPNEVANGIIDALNYLLNANNETQGVNK